MKFTKLRLLGFKSFVEPTEFLIEDGLTGVVGPNGCGKSNLVEALRWVMGENSYKNMRASGMDDVIFSGSGNRPARNTAEVSLFLDNSDRTAPAAFNDTEDLQISRRIERESGSVYRINGKDVRAKDVQLLFADASTGARSPSMVGQGRIGELISAKPQARRALLEEAAGISGLHSRRHEAELRLRATETNLDRLEDVIGQLDSQLESLRRQARQANRYRNLSEEIKKTEALLLHQKWSAAKEADSKAESELSQSNLAMGEFAKTQAQTARDEAVASAALPALREEEAKAAAILQHVQITKTQLEEEASRLEFRRTELENRLSQLESDLKREEQLHADNTSTLQRLDEEQKELETQSESVGETEEKSKLELEKATKTLGESEVKFSELTVKLADENARRQQLKRSVQDARSRKDRVSGQSQAAKSELTAIIEKISSLSAPAEKQILVQEAEKVLTENELQLEKAEQTTSKAREIEEALRSPLENAERELRETETEARTLRQIVNRAGQDLFPAIVENITVEPGFEKALGAALGEDLDISVDPNAPVHWSGSTEAENDPKLPGGVQPLLDVVSAPEELKRRLSQIGIVDEEKGAAISRELSSGQRIVTKQGDLWRWDGFVASAEAPTAATIRLEQKNRLSELEKIQLTQTDTLENAKKAHDEGKATTKQALETERGARDLIRQNQKDLANARENLAAAEREVGQFASKRTALEDTVERLAIDLEEAEKQISSVEKALSEVADTSKLEAELEILRLQVAQDRAQLAEARATSQSLTKEAEVRGRRLEAIQGERKSWQKRLDNAQKQLGTLNKRHEETKIELGKLTDAPGDFEVKRRDLIRKIEEAEVARKAAADKLAVGETSQADASRAARSAIEALAEAREKVGRSEERLLATRERRKEVEARIREDLECHPADALAIAELGPDEKLPDSDKTENKLERLKADRERLGPVNLRADAEQTEIAEKRVEIITERDDLIAAIAKLRSGIQSLNKEGRERLLQAFDIVNDQFKRLFTHLFGGGTAELQLIESDDPLEAGLEILARPPGKKPQTMTLLSGGEQALTAMALIFAVFLTNPAPICVLDEVDAPLDDHNVERFCNLMDEMAETTQTKFLLITHNPITMSRMNRMFGVTMAERGVSQLVSVSLEDAEKLSESA